MTGEWKGTIHTGREGGIGWRGEREEEERGKEGGCRERGKSSKVRMTWRGKK